MNADDHEWGTVNYENSEFNEWGSQGRRSQGETSIPNNQMFNIQHSRRGCRDGGVGQFPNRDPH